MRIVVDHYAYVYVKITFLKMLNLTDEKYKELEVINDEKDLLLEIDKYFPGISKIRDFNLINLERELFNIYFKFIEKILVNSPRPMQEFLLSLLYRFEIWNVKLYILDMIAGIELEQIKKDIIEEPEIILQRMKFIEKLLGNKNIKDGIEFLEKDVLYGKSIKRGWHYFTESNEVFMIEGLLDKLFCEKLIDKMDDYKGLEKRLFSQYTDYICERYNLNLIFRGIKTKIPTELIKQLIISRSILFDDETINILINSKNPEDFTNNIKAFFQDALKKPEFRRNTMIIPISNRNQFYNNLISKITVEDPINPILSKLNRELFYFLEIAKLR
jgi:vacuolar-type H+-ATPase subunit C/Vma6